MSGGKTFHWVSLMAHFLGERGMRPADFWALTLQEIRAILGGEAVSALLITARIDDPVPPGVRHLDTSVCGLDGPLLEPYALDRLARRLEGHDSGVVACAPGRREEWTIVLRAMGLRAQILNSELHDAEAMSPTNP